MMTVVLIIVLLLIVLAPLFVVCAVVTMPLWIVLLIIRRVIKDPAFQNSVQFVAQFLLIPLSLFITLPFWMFFQEYMYQLRNLRTDK